MAARMGRMNRSHFALSLIILLPLACAPNIPPETARFSSRSNIEYAAADGESLKLDAFVPDGTGPFPVAIVVHGGGWGGGDKAKDITGVLRSLGDAHFVWFSINYRLAPKYKWPACYDDVRAAIAWVKAHATEFNGDPNRIVLIGYSAGGELACLAAVQGAPVEAVVGISPPTDMEADTQRRGGLRKSCVALF